MFLGAALAALLAGNAAALSNTSPAMLLSDKKPLHFDGELSALPSMTDLFDGLAADATNECQYHAYIFMKQSNVSETEINGRTMPFLFRTAERSQGKYIQGTVLESDEADVDASVAELKRSIESRCGAKSIKANPKSSKPYQPYIDTTPRVISVEYPANTLADEADESLKQIIGHLPTPDFFVAYYTTPLKTRADDDDQPSTPSRPSASSGPVKEIPYDSVFRNYQFFSPGLFMGLIASVFFIVVFAIAFKSVDSLQISYAAFEPKRETKKKVN